MEFMLELEWFRGKNASFSSLGWLQNQCGSYSCFRALTTFAWVWLRVITVLWETGWSLPKIKRFL